MLKFVLPGRIYLTLLGTPIDGVTTDQKLGSNPQLQRSLSPPCRLKLLSNFENFTHILNHGTIYQNQPWAPLHGCIVYAASAVIVSNSSTISEYSSFAAISFAIGSTKHRDRFLFHHIRNIILFTILVNLPNWRSDALIPFYSIKTAHMTEPSCPRY